MPPDDLTMLRTTMTVPVNYVVIPGYTPSRYDKQRHYIGARELMRLYRVDPRECRIFNPDPAWGELRQIRSAIGANPEESTFDEVRRVVYERDRALADLHELQAALKEAQEQEPVAFWWIGPDGKDNGGPYRGKPSDAAIDNA